MAVDGANVVEPEVIEDIARDQLAFDLVLKGGAPVVDFVAGLGTEQDVTVASFEGVIGFARGNLSKEIA